MTTEEEPKAEKSVYRIEFKGIVKYFYGPKGLKVKEIFTAFTVANFNSKLPGVSIFQHLESEGFTLLELPVEETFISLPGQAHDFFKDWKETD